MTPNQTVMDQMATLEDELRAHGNAVTPGEFWRRKCRDALLAVDELRVMAFRHSTDYLRDVANVRKV